MCGRRFAGGRVSQRSHAKSSVDDLGAGRGVVHGRAVPILTHTAIFWDSALNSTGRFVLPARQVSPLCRECVCVFHTHTHTHTVVSNFAAKKELLGIQWCTDLNWYWGESLLCPWSDGRSVAAERKGSGAFVGGAGIEWEDWRSVYAGVVRSSSEWSRKTEVRRKISLWPGFVEVVEGDGISKHSLRCVRLKFLGLWEAWEAAE